MYRLRSIINDACNLELNGTYESRKEIEETGIEVTDIVGLPRARKIQARLGARTAEVSIFQGKDSFTVVFSPRSGTDGELNRLLADMVKNFLSNMD